MHLPRFRLRTLRIAVTVAALALAVYADIERRRAYFQAVVRHHWEMVAANSIIHKTGYQTSYEPGPSLRNCQRAAYHRGLVNKYRQAARRPWLPVAPDPPPPKWSPE